MLRVADGVAPADISIEYTVEEHVHLAYSPGGEVHLLAEERNIAVIAIVLLNILFRLNKHAAGPASRIIYTHTRLRVDKMHKQANYKVRSVKLTALFPCTVGELLDEIFISCSQK